MNSAPELPLSSGLTTGNKVSLEVKFVNVGNVMNFGHGATLLSAIFASQAMSFGPSFIFASNT